jgi:hypothetical protein
LLNYIHKFNEWWDTKLHGAQALLALIVITVIIIINFIFFKNQILYTAFATMFIALRLCALLKYLTNGK